MKKTIYNATIISPGYEQSNASLLIEDGRISSLHGADSPAADEMIDAEGRFVFPGFIDIHSHGADGRDVCDDSLEALQHISRRKLQEGVTTWLPTTLTQPQAKLCSIAEKIAEFRTDSPTRCPGMHVEGPFINRDKAGAQNPEFVRPPNFEELAELHQICPASIVSIAPELPGALEVIRQAREVGITSSAAHTASTAAEIRDAVDAGLTHLTHFGNAMTPLHHREIGVVGEGILNDSLMIEIIGDGIHLAPDMLRLIFKAIPLERLMLITDSVAASWIGQGVVQLGGLDVVVADGVARLKEGGALAGSALLFNEGLKNLVEITALPLSELVQVTSLNQARSLGLEGFGKIEPGYYADLAILNPDFSVWKTLVGGEEK